MIRVHLENGTLGAPVVVLDLGEFEDAFGRVGKGGWEGWTTFNGIPSKASLPARPWWARLSDWIGLTEAPRNAEYVLVAGAEPITGDWYSAAGEGPFKRIRIIPQ